MNSIQYKSIDNKNFTLYAEEPKKWNRAKEIAKTALPYIASAGLVASFIVLGACTLGWGLLGAAVAILAIKGVHEYRRHRKNNQMKMFYHHHLQASLREQQSLRNDLHKERWIKESVVDRVKTLENRK